jgi:hypothetical protein
VLERHFGGCYQELRNFGEAVALYRAMLVVAARTDSYYWTVYALQGIRFLRIFRDVEMRVTREEDSRRVRTAREYAESEQLTVAYALIRQDAAVTVLLTDFMGCTQIAAAMTATDRHVRRGAHDLRRYLIPGRGITPSRVPQQRAAHQPVRSDDPAPARSGWRARSPVRTRWWPAGAASGSRGRVHLPPR